jgi:predicted site-specific integrase-resolvase
MQDAYPTNNGEVLRKAEASKFLGISPRGLDTWMKRGIVPFSKLPSGAVRFRKSQLIEMLATYEVGGRRAGQ